MSLTALHFRVAEPGDAGLLGEFMARNFLAAYGHCSSPENIQAAVAEHYGQAAQLRQILDPNRWNLLLLSGDDWVGHAQLKFGAAEPTHASKSPAHEVSRFYIDTRFHGQGAAQTMMDEVKREARLRGAASLWLSVWQESPQPIRFYTKSGFRIAGELVFMVGDDPKDDWLMVANLDAP